MEDFNEQIPNPIEEPKKERMGEKPRRKGWMTGIVGGIVGSMLTLAIAPQLPDIYSMVGKEIPALSENTSNGNTSSVSQSSGAVKIQKTAATNTTNSVADIVESASKSVVGIVNMQMQSQIQQNPFANSESGNTNSGLAEAGSGTGVIFKIDNNYAYIVTNNHVIENAKELNISLSNGQKTTGQIIGADTLTDVAVLKIEAKYAPSSLEFGDSSKLRAGDTVLAIGNPLGLDLSNTVTQGIVSAVDRTVSVSTSAGKWDLNVIQTDAAINPGNSGGALINTSGQVIGMNSLKVAENGVEGLGFAIPSNDLVPVINQIIENGQVVRPYIGVGLTSLSEIPQMYLQNIPDNVKEGAMVSTIDPNSAAAKSGLKLQDIIVSINDNKVTSSDDLRKYLYSNLKVGDKVTLKIYRGSEQKTITLTLTSSSKTN